MVRKKQPKYNVYFKEKGKKRWYLANRGVTLTQKESEKEMNFFKHRNLKDTYVTKKKRVN